MNKITGKTINYNERTYEVIETDKYGNIVRKLEGIQGFFMMLAVKRWLREG